MSLPVHLLLNSMEYEIMALPFYARGQTGHLQLCKKCPFVTGNQGLVQPAGVKYN